tara:strand:- start:94 stop:636 length:543 start_codon:yes stop_codon:yes gene_type:complete
MQFKKGWYLVFAVCLSLVLSGCQSARKALNMNTSAVIQFEADASINPDADDRPSPVVVHVFKLADERQFSREDFLSLYEGAPARLGKDLLDTLVLKEITPGEVRVESIELTTEVKYIGLMAEFIQYRDAEALLVIPVLEHNENAIHVGIRDNQIAIIEKTRDDSGATPHKKLRSDRSSQL